MKRLSHWRPFLFLCIITIVSACSRPAGAIAIRLVTSPSIAAYVRVSGLSSAELASVRGFAADDARWSTVLHVRVAGSAADAPAVAGKYVATSDAIEFVPRFPFDPGRQYEVSFDAAQLPVPRAGPVSVATVGLSAGRALTPSTTITRMYPTADELPENLLRVYLEFSAPMSRENGRDFLTLLDEQGHVVPDTFLALDIEFWSPDYRRYTVFLDPGRVKRGILPNDIFGRALRAGHSFTLVVDPRWRDANGQPLAAPFRRTFRVIAPDMAPIRVADWTLTAPRAGTRDPLVVAFPKPLDHGLLQRALGVADATAATMAGEITVGARERSWSFTPARDWPAGTYSLVVLDILEDPAGNRIGRPFDIDRFEHIDQSAQPERRLRAFTVK